MPHEVVYGAMAASPDHRGVLVLGGLNFNCCWTSFGWTGYGNRRYRKKKCDGGYPTNTILELQIGAKSWTFLNITLQSKRHNHAVNPLKIKF